MRSLYNAVRVIGAGLLVAYAGCVSGGRSSQAVQTGGPVSALEGDRLSNLSDEERS